MFRFTQSEATAARRNISFYAASATDGFTAVTTGITSPTITIYKNGTGTAVTPVSPTVTHLINGLWSYQLAATDIDTVGMVSVTIAHASIRTVHLIGHVYSGDAFNSPTTTQTGNLDAAISTRMGSYTQPTGFLSASFPAGTIANTTNITAGTITTATSVTNNVTVGTINNGVITAASIATDAIQSTKIQDGALVIGSASGTGVKAYLAANAIAAGNIATGAIDADSIADSAITIRMSGDSTPSEGRIVAGSIASDVWNALYASYNTANTFGKLMDTIRKANFVVEGTTTAGSTTTVINTNLTGYVLNAFDNQTILFISGTLAGTSGIINGNNAGASVITLDEVIPGAPAAGVDFVIMGTHVHSKGGIADTLLGRNLAGGSNGGRMVKDALRVLRNRTSITGTTLTVCDESDNLTTGVAWTATLNTNPLADPVTGIDPA
jgi:hypothetical protein